MFARRNEKKCSKNGNPAGPANSSRGRPSRCFRADDAAGEGRAIARGATREGASRGARAGHGSRSGAGCWMGQRRAPRNRPQAGPGRWRGARCTNQGGGAGSALRAAHACALVRLPALPGWVGRCAPTARPPARRRLPGGWGAERPHESARQWRPQRRWLRRPQARSAQRLPTERPLPPLWDTLFRPGAKPERGMGGVSEASGGGRGSGPPLPRANKGAALRARYRVPKRVGGLGAVAARQAGPRQETSISSRLGLYRGPAGRLSSPRYGTRMAKSSPAPRCAALIGAQTRANSAGIGPRIVSGKLWHNPLLLAKKSYTDP